MSYFKILPSVIVFSLAACGGDSNDIASTPNLASGNYSAILQSGNTVTDSGYMLIDSTGDAVYASQRKIAFGVWSTSGRERTISLKILNKGGTQASGVAHSPGAHVLDEQMSVTVENTSATTWQGSAFDLTLDNKTAPAFAQIPRNWRYTAIIPFTSNGSQNISYTAQVDVDSSGLLSGFDTNGCSFSGELQTRTDSVPIYAARIVALNCTSTDAFIENREYRGFAYLAPAQGGIQQRLHIAAVNTAASAGIEFQLSPR